ncbi:hypothetical protein SALBM135S_01809 [Streptomyces alboniger]
MASRRGKRAETRARVPSRVRVAQPPRRRRKVVGRNTASAVIIAEREDRQPEDDGDDGVLEHHAREQHVLDRRLNRVKGKATCMTTVPYVTASIRPLEASSSERAGHGEK